jgi:ribonuclease HII
MPYLLGTDEAGYGPNLGPLVISASVWRVEEPPGEVDLYARLASAVAAKADPQRIAIADSKTLYKPGGTLRLLERGLLPALRLVGGAWPRDCRDVWELLDADGAGHRHALPWHADYQLPLPTAAEPDELEPLAPRLEQVLARERITLCAIRSQAVFPRQFNDACDEHGTKGAALSTFTLRLVADLLRTLEPEPALIVCDKHGGRNRYGELLRAAFPGSLIEAHGESRAESVYRWGPRSARVEIRFRAKAEACLPAALASMTCKYLRELSMRAFNDYWRTHIADLRPTAGYPVDARRFKAAIAPLQAALGISDRILWRER